MKKISLLITLNLFFLSVNANGIKKDTASIVINAKHDAKNFSYDKADKKGVIDNLNNPNSDYFKPSIKTSNASLLNDSIYVRTFKLYAIKHIRAKRTTKTLLFVGGGIVAFLALIVAALVAAGPGLTN